MTDEALHVILVIGIKNLSDPANLPFFTLRLHDAVFLQIAWGKHAELVLKKILVDVHHN